MKNRLTPYFLLLLMSLGVAACTNPGETTTAETVEEPPMSLEDLPPLLQQTLEAHGGWEVWNAYHSLEFTLQSFGNGDTSQVYSIVDLKNRREHIEAENYEMGFDGENYWFHADSIPENHPDPKFYINLQFYFFAMPFVAADPGTQYEAVGQRMLDGQAYDVLKLTYADTVGQSPEDQYLLYLNPDNHQLHLLLYSVTYFDESNADQYNALLYEEWQTVDELQVPLRATSYAWNQETQELGDPRGTKQFFPVDFDKIPPMDATFEVPEGAKVIQ